MIVALSAILLAAAPTARAQERPAADADAPAPAAAAPEDVTDQVRVEVVGTLLSNTDGVLFTGVVIENTTEKNLSGRLVLVVDETGIDGLSMAANDGALDGGERYLELLPSAGVLKAGAKSSSRRIEFTSAARVSAAARKEFAPKFRVLRVDAPLPPANALEPSPDELLPGKKYSQARLDSVMRIQEAHTPKLMETPGVFGTSVSENENGDLVVRVFTQRHGIIKDLPGDVGGVPLDQKVTGSSFRAGPAWTKTIEINGRKHIGGTPIPAVPLPADPLDVTYTPTDPTLRFERPVPIGVSLFDLDDPICASGTLGARIVFADGRLGILTNSHVGARVSAPTAQAEDRANGIIGDQWTQPGCGDAFFDVDADILATLVDFQTFDAFALSNVIDASVGRINGPNLVLARTPEDGYGFPSRTPVAPRIGMRVMKYGRTTGLRYGTIEGLNTLALVNYNTAVYSFSGQLTIYGDDFPFGAPGDSGSLIVTEDGHHPVGLLFAGSGFEVLGNPIQPVLDRFNIAIDDGSGTPPSTTGPRINGRMGGAGGRIITP
jgi:hypothetical protein